MNGPQKVIPDDLLNRYTMGGTVPVLDWWLDGTKDLLESTWDDKYIDSFVSKFTPFNIKNGLLYAEPYPGASRMLLSAFDKYNISEKNVGIVGSTTPWVEAILLNLGNTVTTIEYNAYTNLTERLTCKLYSTFEQETCGYDCIVTYSSVEHSGLGRYGDPLDPDGDIKTMKAICQNLKKDGLCIWGAPVGEDALVWNVHRVYGNKRLPLLFKNFKEIEWIGCQKQELVNKPLFKNGFQPVVILKSI